MATDGTRENESYQRGVSHGWDAANYAKAYGTSEPRDVEASRRADGDGEYETGFIEGWDRYCADQWSDGTPCEDVHDDTFMCFTCAFQATGTRDERDAAHLRHDGAHEANWYRSSDETFERDLD